MIAKPIGRHHYPDQTVTYEQFIIQMNNCLTQPFTNEIKLKLFYHDYIMYNYGLVLHWIEVNGYDTVEEWCEEIMFKDWDFDKHSTILKSKFKSNYNNIKPEKNE